MNQKKVLLIDNNSGYISNIKKLCEGYIIDVISFYLLGRLNEGDLSQYSLIILSGGKLPSLNIFEKELSTEINLVKKLNKPIIGICYGSEIIAISFGARLEFTGRIYGPTNVNILYEHPIFGDMKIGETFEVWSEHKFGLKELPEQLEGLAKSEDDLYYIFKQKEKEIYGLQFHPEAMTEATFGDEIGRNLIDYLMTK